MPISDAYSTDLNRLRRKYFATDSGLIHSLNSPATKNPNRTYIADSRNTFQDASLMRIIVSIASAYQNPAVLSCARPAA